MPDTPQRLSQYPLGRLRLACDHCGRRGSYSVARLGERHGAEIPLGDLLRILTASCKWQRDPKARSPRQYEPRCLAHYPDLMEPEPSPPAEAALRIVRGGRR
jgi:hypothetical protein